MDPSSQFDSLSHLTDDQALLFLMLYDEMIVQNYSRNKSRRRININIKYLI